MKKMEVRANNVEVRATENGSLIVEGYVNETGQPSEILGGHKRFREKILKGAFQRAIDKAQKQGIDFLAEHDKSKILSSTTNDSLILKEDSKGLFMSATITPTSWGKDYYELIKSNILSKMSFGFRTIKDKWSENVTGVYDRTIEELELFEVSVVRNPAYSQSNIAARGIDIEDAEEENPIIEIPKEKLEDLYFKLEKIDANNQKMLKDIKIFSKSLEKEKGKQFNEERSIYDKVIALQEIH
ncbi:HK97 family phage prohead protease [Sinobaca qinghaiensis]|uniref:HK97 family phage prohead protease n=1 Tax=Sinobaca qinghaiensis TaxID=342944 RepID=A0A419VTT1_9BACL|nr:HK97 family phage prohead protease [Sinobaca qinghaiensis]